MLKRLYVHNFRCLENFELPLNGASSILMLGRNGSGKTTIALAFEILQKIARGTNRVGDLVGSKDFAGGRTQAPIRFEIEVTLENRGYAYSVAFEFPTEFGEPRVLEESLTVDGRTIYARQTAQVRLARAGSDTEAAFRIDWHLVALPIVQERSADDPIYIFRTWLASALVLKPAPNVFRGESDVRVSGNGTPDRHASDIGAWFSITVARAPSIYSQVSDFLQQILPDFSKITNPLIGRDKRNLIFHFNDGAREVQFNLEDLSDGEKCFFLYALVIAVNSALGPLLCFWDEPDNFLSPDEVGHSILALRKTFQGAGQLIVMSHDPETIRRFSEEDTFYLSRKSHLEPTIVTSIESMRASGRFEGGFVDALTRGDLAS